MILPDTMEIRIVVPIESRNTAWVSFDGRHRVNLKAGDSIGITSSPFPVPTICKDNQSGDWFGSLERCLGWNKREKQKTLDVY
jgi:NAD+ kinase